MSHRTFRGHLPPGFSRATDDAHRVEYPPEAHRSQMDDSTNYGVGGLEHPTPSPYGYRSMAHRLQAEGSRSHGSHRGKGPRSYKRSDARILEDLNQRLYDDPFVNAADVETAVQNGEVILSGIIADRRAKRRVEDIAEGVRGVTNVENRLRLMDSTF